MKTRVTNIVIAGLGGQGVITLSDILADAAFRAGKDVKKAEVHGMSQRGGSVTSDVRYGDEVLSPMVSAGEADFLIVMEPTQVQPTRHFLKPQGVLLEIGMLNVAELPSPKTVNVAMLGLLSARLPDISKEQFLQAVRAHLPEKLHEMNTRAFEVGRTVGEEGHRHV